MGFSAERFSGDVNCLAQVAAMVKHGQLKYLTQFEKMHHYWENLLRDYPNHPVHGHEATSVPLTLYGAWPAIRICTVF